MAQAEVADAEVVREAVSVHEGYSVCPDTGETLHEVYETHELVETVEPAEAPVAEAPVIAEDETQPDPRDARIAELETELARVTAELKVFQDAKMAAELQAKQDKAKAFAQKQGLNVEDEAVAHAISEVNYEAIAELAMASEPAQETPAPAAVEVTMASFVDMEISGDDEYGGLLKRKSHN